MPEHFFMIGPDGKKYQTLPLADVLPNARRLWEKMAAAERQVLEGGDPAAYGAGVAECLSALFGQQQAKRLLLTASPAELLLLTAPLFRHYLLPSMAQK